MSDNIEEIPLTALDLEARISCFHDIKKELRCMKSFGWYWSDRGEEDVENWCGPFPTAWGAIIDATEPYFTEENI